MVITGASSGIATEQAAAGRLPSAQLRGDYGAARQAHLWQYAESARFATIKSGRRITASALNRMAQFGIPISVKIV